MIRLRIVSGLAGRSSRLGERLGWDWLTYNRLVFMHFHRVGLADAPKMARALIDNLPEFKSLADIGCGSGAFAAALQREGILAIGFERGRQGRKMAMRQEVECFPFDASQGYKPLIGSPFHVAMSLEVGEHIPPEFTDTFVEYLTRTASRFIVLTCAHPGQGGQGHVNEQPQSYWILKVTAKGWRYSQELSEKVARSLKVMESSDWLYQNMMVFESS